MIQVILLILKIIGITLLAILGLILLVLALVLFVPIFYRVRVIHNPEQTKVTARVSFLFPLLLVTVQYLKKLTYKVRIFGIALLDSEKPKKEKKPKKPKQKKPKQKKERKKKKKPQPVVEEKPQEDIFEPLENPGALPEWKPETETGQNEEVKPQEEKSEESKPGFFEKIRAKIQKIRDTISNVCNKVKKLLHQKDEVLRILNKEETKRVIAFVWKKLKHLLKHILPRKIKGYVAFGADDPSTTGQVLGILSVVYAKTGQLLEIRPNFVEKQLECDVQLKGRIQVFTLLVIAIKVALNKELRQLIKEFKNLKEIE